MIEAVFISDLHLHPAETAITKRFNAFLRWAGANTRTLYILGDLFHAWPGDDALDAWSRTIAEQLANLASQGMKIYFMHGNRDFLIGEHFAKLAKFTIIKEPYIISLGDKKVVLMHGDRYCTHDTAHQWLRRLTRNHIFPKLFLSIPYAIRSRLVRVMREHSQTNRSKPMEKLAIVPAAMLTHMQKLNVSLLIHGHIHTAGHNNYSWQGNIYQQYILSDWDDNPQVMCYDKSNGFYFELIPGD